MSDVAEVLLSIVGGEVIAPTGTTLSATVPEISPSAAAVEPTIAVPERFRIVLAAIAPTVRFVGPPVSRIMWSWSLSASVVAEPAEFPPPMPVAGAAKFTSCLWSARAASVATPTAAAVWSTFAGALAVSVAAVTQSSCVALVNTNACPAMPGSSGSATV
jgi:hypothetical protein